MNYYTRQIARDREVPDEQNLPPPVFQVIQNDYDWQEMELGGVSGWLIQRLNLVTF